MADRVAGCLPPEHLEIRITVTGTQSRQFEVLAHGERYLDVIGRLPARLSPQQPP